MNFYLGKSVWNVVPRSAGVDATSPVSLREWFFMLVSWHYHYFEMFPCSCIIKNMGSSF